MAVFNVDGTRPDWREWLMAFVIRGLMEQMFSFIWDVGKGSRAQVEGFIFLMISSTSCCVVVEKQQRGREIDGRGPGEAGSVERVES